MSEQRKEKKEQKRGGKLKCKGIGINGERGRTIHLNEGEKVGAKNREYSLGHANVKRGKKAEARGKKK